ncbi:glycerate 3-kinase [Abditibacteriota bacterium]|nr:glycerate 3-kinase [Abditibacteriota bacterium]
MKIVLAPDSFKGSLSAVEVCAAMKRGIQKALPDAEILEVPLADGGEGTLDALLLGAGGFRRTVRVRGPLDESIEADWGFLPDGTAIIELAQASGLTLTPLERRSPLRASTFGTGQLIRAALDAGARRFFIGLGGSATTDGATGLLSALGARFFDERDCIIPSGGGDLSRLARVDLQFFDPRLQKCEFIALCDVSNPLCGPNGAAHIFSPQKGATPEQAEQLDASLARFAEVTAQHLGRDLQNQPGAGAAGGTGFGLMAYLDAQMKPGIEAVLEATEFSEKLDGADLVLTGEGSLDTQTLNGKTIAGVCRVAREKSVPVVALGGRIALSGKQLDGLGLKSAFSIVDGPRDLEWCLENGATLVETTCERILRTIR